MEGETPIQPVASETPAAEQAQTPEPKIYDEAYVKKITAENAAYRVEKRDRDKADEAKKIAEMSELEKAQKAANDADARATATEQRLAKRDALDALRAANVIDADLAFMAIKDAIEVKDGEPANISELVAQFIADRPAMVKAAETAKPAAPATKSTNPAPPTVAATKRQPGRL